MTQAVALAQQASTGVSPGFRNRIINGAMVFDQRNAGASVTINTGAANYTLDRWFGFGQATDGVYTIQRSTTAPTGFVNSLLATVTTADASVGASQTYNLVQYIEGFNTADLGWGTANAQTVTLSFWVRSSVTGTFSGSIRNGSGNRSYPFTYTISSANTFEYKTITIAGDTTGTWATDNTSGPQLWFSLGTGSTLSGTAGAWAASNFTGATGGTALISTLSATFYITGVQLEVGSTATSFDYRPYTTELQLCQRYLPAFNGEGNHWAGQAYSGANTIVPLVFPVQTRVAPTGITASSASHFRLINSSGSALTVTSLGLGQAGTLSGYVNFAVSSGLSGGNGTVAYSSSASAQILFTGCEL